MPLGDAAWMRTLNRPADTIFSIDQQFLIETCLSPSRLDYVLVLRSPFYIHHKTLIIFSNMLPVKLSVNSRINSCNADKRFMKYAHALMRGPLVFAPNKQRLQFDQ